MQCNAAPSTAFVPVPVKYCGTVPASCGVCGLVGIGVRMLTSTHAWDMPVAPTATAALECFLTAAWAGKSSRTWDAAMACHRMFQLEPTVEPWKLAIFTMATTCNLGKAWPAAACELHERTLALGLAQDKVTRLM